jgi:hypothetical protein
MSAGSVCYLFIVLILTTLGGCQKSKSDSGGVIQFRDDGKWAGPILVKARGTLAPARHCWNGGVAPCQTVREADQTSPRFGGAFLINLHPLESSMVL